MTLKEFQKQYRKELLNSILDRDIKKAKILIKSGNGLDFFIDDKTPLMYACSYSKHIALNMLQVGANPKLVNNQGRTALFYACSQGDYELVRRLHELNAFNVIEDKYGNNILHYATNANSRQVVDFLLDLNMDPNPRDTNGKTPLHYAAWHGYTNVCESLIKKGGLVNLLDENNNSPILYATDLDTIKILLDYNSQILSNGKETLVHKLIEKNKVEEIEYLDKRLGSLNKVLGPNSCNPLLFAVFNDNYLLTKFFIEKGYDVNTFNEMGLTPLMRAVEKGNILLVKLLVDNGANVNFINKRNENAFLIACKHNNLKIIKYLQDLNENINFQDDALYTPLMWASMYKYDNVCDFLIENGADHLLKNKYNKTAMVLADEVGNKYFKKEVWIY